METHFKFQHSTCVNNAKIFACMYFRDGRLHAGDELLMINGQSLVGLTHQEAVDILRSAAGLVQLVVARRVSAHPHKHTHTAKATHYEGG